MYRKYAVKFHKKQVEFINCVNMVERVKRARAISPGCKALGEKRYVISSSDLGKEKYLTIRDCA